MAACCVVMTYIMERLYLGGMDDAANTQQLRQNGVTHILTIDWKPISQEWRENFEYQYIYAMDEDGMDLLSRLDECIQFISSGRKVGGVFVHCQAGMSRSATVVIAYVMNSMGLNCIDALRLVSRQRPSIMPNDGFMEQLRLFEKMGNKMDAASGHCRRYRLRRLAAMMQETRNPGTTLQENMLSADPICSSDSEAGVVYKCRKCRRPLFREEVIISHSTGRGQQAFQWRNSSAGTSYELDRIQSDDAIQCTGRLFIEPIQWMGQSISTVEGKLACPKCTAKLGSFNWAGERCPCGRWITPSFHILNGKVDRRVPRVTSPGVQQGTSGEGLDRCVPRVTPPGEQQGTSGQEDRELGESTGKSEQEGCDQDLGGSNAEQTIDGEAMICNND